MNHAFGAIMQNTLSFKLIPISIRELLYLEDCPCDIYGIREGLFTKILSEKSPLSRDILRELITGGHAKLFVLHKQRGHIIEKVQRKLTQVTRSLSIGDPFENCKSQMNLLTINLEYLYLDTTNDEFLSLQAQSIKNLFHFLVNHIDLHEKLYTDFLKQKHHYIFSQPMLASLLLCGVMKFSKLLTLKEMESLFIASYFKDIGMSAIPTESYDKPELSRSEKKILANHASNSVEILKGRLPLPNHSLNIILNHHAFSLLTKEIESDIENSKLNYQLLNKNQKDEQGALIIGSETVLVSALDIIAAMITPRPWRGAEKLFNSLDLVRKQISEEFPQEFKYIVSYFKQFKFQ